MIKAILRALLVVCGAALIMLNLSVEHRMPQKFDLVLSDIPFSEYLQEAKQVESTESRITHFSFKSENTSIFFDRSYNKLYFQLRSCETIGIQGDTGYRCQIDVVGFESDDTVHTTYITAVGSFQKPWTAYKLPRFMEYTLMSEAPLDLETNTIVCTMKREPVALLIIAVAQTSLIFIVTIVIFAFLDD